MPENNNSFINVLLFILYLVFFISLVFSLRAVSSMSIGALLIAGFIKNKTEQKSFFYHGLKNPLLVLYCLFFLLQFVSLFYSDNITEGWKNIRLKSALVIVPVALCCCGYITEITRKKILNWYCLVLFAACLFAIYAAFRNYAGTNNASVFLYHSLVSIYSGHAIQFSILVFIALLHLIETVKKKEILFNKIFHFLLIVFFLFFLLLLSSRLVIVFFLVYFFYTMARLFVVKPIARVFIIVSAISIVIIFSFLYFTHNPVSGRFKEITKTDFTFLEKEKFNAGDHFNGLQFRLLQWKFVPEILNGKKAWLAGTGVGDAQPELNKKYISEDMYTGTPARGDKGFLGYNTHNQFLEALLQTGIIGLSFFLAICFALIKLAWQRKKAEFSFVTILLLAYSFSESVFETQYSLLIFLFFPLFFYLDKNTDPA
jgi:O-antigen ligase